MRVVRRLLALLVVMATSMPAAAAPMGGAWPAPAAQTGTHTVTVNTIDDQWDWFNPNAASTKCSLREALQLLGTPATNLGCGTAPATARVFNVNFFTSGTYVLTYDDDLPHIGNGYTVNIDEWSLTIDGGMSGSLTDRHRGIFRVVGGTLNLKQITLRNGSRPGGGGAVELDGGTLTADRVTFKGNQAVLDGGALVVSGGAVVTVTNSIFEDNYAFGHGGAVATPFGYFYKTQFIGNGAGGGGAVYVKTVATPVEFVECEFKENRAKPSPFNEPGPGYDPTSDPFGGGAIQVQGGGYVRLYRSLVKDNTAEMTKGGGGMSNDGGHAVIEESVFTGNVAIASDPDVNYAWGGAILHAGGAQTELLRASIHGNQADVAGAIYLDGGELQSFNATISGNTATFSLGGLVNGHDDYNLNSGSDAGGTVRLYYTTIGKNSGGLDDLLWADVFKSVYFSSSILDAGCNVTQYTHGHSFMTGACPTDPDPQDPSAGMDVYNVSPSQLLLQPLANGDIPVPEFMVQEIDSNSIAVDAGRMDDQKGCAHPLIDFLDNNLASRGSLCDAGALEASEAPPHFQSNPPPGLIEFPVVRFNQGQTFSTVNLEIQNTGGGAMDYSVVDEGGSQFHTFVTNQSPSQGTLYKNGSAILLLRCQPTQLGDHWKTISIHTNADNHGGSYKLRCTGAGAEALASTSQMPGPLNMPMGPPGMPQHSTVKLINNGQMPLTADYGWQMPGPMWSATPMGPMLDGQGLAEALNVTIPPGQTLSLDLTCNPPVPGVFVNTFTITTNDPVSPAMDYDVACEGELDSPPEPIEAGTYYASADGTELEGMAVSPEGALVLVGHYDDNTVRVYDRNTTTGALTPNFYSVSSLGMTQIYGIAFSHDGQNAYYTSQAGDGIVQLNRAGSIFGVGEVITRTTRTCPIILICPPYNTMDGARGLAVSPDDRNVYVTGYLDGSLTVFSRNTSSGDLGHAQRITETVTGPGVLGGAARVVVSPDGEHVYVAAYNDDAISVFRRDSAGRLAFLDVYKDGVGGLNYLNQPTDLALSPDGEYLYVVSFADDAVSIFRRSSGDGGLALADVLTLTGVGLWGVAISPDDYGRRLYLTDYSNDRVLAYSRDPNTGVLSHINTLTDSVAHNGPVFFALSPDNQHLYVSLYEGLGLRQFNTVRHAPVMGNLSPASAVQGGPALNLTVNGSRFYPGSTVQFGIVNLATTFVSDRQLVALAPSGVLTAPFSNVTVRVTSPTPGGGQSEPATFLVTAPGAAPVPSIESVEPPGVSFSGEDVMLLIHGANFQPNSQVTYNGALVPAVYLNAQTLQVTLSAALLSQPGTGGLAVSNPTPGTALLAADPGAAVDLALAAATASTVFGFQVMPSGTPALPSITRLEPASVLSGTTSSLTGTVGLWISVFGSNFADGTPGASVGRFNGQERPTVVVHEGLLKMLLSPDDLNAAGDYAITVFTDGAGESTLADFRVRPPGEKPIPVLSVAAVDGGRQLYLFGSDFDPGAQVHLNGSPRSANVVHSGLITLQLSPADQGGVVTVTNPGPGGGASNALAFIARVSWLPIMRR